jgi:hypothetical protein
MSDEINESEVPEAPEVPGVPEGSEAQDAPEVQQEQKPRMELAQLKAVIEALIFASPDPITPRMLNRLLNDEPKEDVKAALEALKADYVDRGGLPLRAVLCLSAYKKLTGLYDVSVLVATVDAPQQGVQGRFDAQGVTFDNALKLTTHYLEGFRWTRTPTP